MEVKEVIRKHLFEAEPEFVSNVAMDLGIANDKVHLFTKENLKWCVSIDKTLFNINSREVREA